MFLSLSWTLSEDATEIHHNFLLSYANLLLVRSTNLPKDYIELLIMSSRDKINRNHFKIHCFIVNGDINKCCEKTEEFK